MKYRYNTRVKIIKDEENDGFFIGATVVLVGYDKTSNTYQGIREPDGRPVFGIKEEDIELV